MKFLERIPGTRKRLYQFTAIDDCTRIRVLKVYDACNQSTAITCMNEVLRRLPSESMSCTPTTAPSSSRTFTGISKHSISGTVDDPEFYQLLDQKGISADIHLFNEKLREWLDYYNYHRPHGALDARHPTSG